MDHKREHQTPPPLARVMGVGRQQSGICVWVLVAVVWLVLGVVDEQLWPGSVRVGWYYVCVCCESGLFVLMAGRGICRLCYEDTCSSCCYCCLPSKTYGRNGVTPIFRSFHRTASSSTGGWSRWNILMCFYISF